MNKVSNGWTDKPEMQPRPFKPCSGCRRPLASGETKCQACAQTEKGLGIQGPPGGDADQRPFELPNGDARSGKPGQD